MSKFPNHPRRLLVTLAVLGTSFSALLALAQNSNQPVYQDSPALAPVLPQNAASGAAGHLLSLDFTAQSFSSPKTQVSGGAVASVAKDDFGTIDTYKGAASTALILSADFSKADKIASASLWSGPLRVQNREANLAKLTLGFDVYVRELQPVRVIVQSLDNAGKVSGSRVATIYPPVAGAFHRFSLDLDKTTPLSGQFDPLASRMQLVFALDKSANIAKNELRLDNLNFSAPAYYVAVAGSDASDGRTEKTAFATIQKAVDSAVAGDTILVMEGTYTSAPQADLVRIAKAGAPASWIVLKNYPGQTPLLRGDGWNLINMNEKCAYIELRGLTARGEAAQLTLEAALAESKNAKPDPSYNTNGFALDARKGEENGGKAHHIRFINNTIGEMPGGGISAIAGDHITVEGNHVYENAHFMRYAGSGISVFRGWDFDADKGTKNFVLANRAHGNRCFVPWGAIGKISDGNGIIIDDFINYQNGASKIPYEGRTLVQNNLAYGNGGSGIHAYAANHVDIVNNTAFHNAQSPELNWRQIFVGGKSKDVRVVNNVWWSQSGRPVNFSIGSTNSDILYVGNLVFGDGDNSGGDGGGLGTEAAKFQAKLEGNRTAAPGFVRPSRDSKVADFRLAPGSPGLNAAPSPLFRPLTDIEGNLRSAKPDLGAYESSPE